MIMILCVSLGLQVQKADLSENVTVVAAKGEKDIPGAHELAEAFAAAVEILKVDPSHLPHLVFIFVSQRTAFLQNLPNAAVAVFRTPDSALPGTEPYPSRGVYHIWITASPRMGHAVQGIVMALNAEFDLCKDQQRINALVEHILRRRRDVVSLQALRAWRHDTR